MKETFGVSLDLNLASSIKSRPVTPPFLNCLENKFPKKSLSNFAFYKVSFIS